MSGSPAIKGIVFDKDGTLIDYDDSWQPVNRQLARIASAGDPDLADRLLAACGMDPESGAIVPDSLLAAGNTQEIAAGLRAAGSPLEEEGLVRALDALFAGAADFAVPVTDLAAFFAGLKARGLSLGIASSDNELSIRRLVARLGAEEHVDFIAGYDSGFGGKPGPGMVLGFCAATGLDPQDVAVIGDSNHDLAMARAAGAALAIAVLSGTGTRDSLKDACDHCLDDITGLPDLLDRRTAGASPWP